MNASSRTACITGASSGIGAEYARRLAAEGYNLILHGRRQEKLEELSDAFRRQHGVQTRIVTAELSNEADLARLEQILTECPDLDFLVNNAGYSTLLEFHEEPLDGQEALIRVHVLASVRLAHVAIGRMVQRGRGTIINVSSVAGFFIAPGSVTYCATKAYLTSFSESLHLELKPRGIRVQAFCPGFTRSDFHERLGYNVSGNFFKGFMTATEVVDASLKALKRGTVVCIPGLRYKLAVAVSRLLPRRIIYWFVLAYRGRQKGREQLVQSKR